MKLYFGNGRSLEFKIRIKFSKTALHNIWFNAKTVIFKQLSRYGVRASVKRVDFGSEIDTTFVEIYTMLETVTYKIGDKVQAFDGRIGIVVDIKECTINSKFLTIQTLVVKFPDKSTVEGSAESFKAVGHRTISRINSRTTPVQTIGSW